MVMKILATVLWSPLMLQIHIGLKTVCVCKKYWNLCKKRKRDSTYSYWTCAGKGKGLFFEMSAGVTYQPERWKSRHTESWGHSWGRGEGKFCGEPETVMEGSRHPGGGYGVGVPSVWTVFIVNHSDESKPVGTTKEQFEVMDYRFQSVYRS